MNILILGDGLLATELIKQTGWKHVSRKQNGFDFTKIGTYSHLLKGYDTIINCIAFTSTYSDNKEKNWDINYKSIGKLVEYCNLNQVKLIHISTDYLYANSNIYAKETEIPQPIPTWYGYTKMLGDAHVQAFCDKHLIIRTSFKPYPFPYDKAWYDQFTSGDLVNKISEIIIKLINKNAEGVFNVGTKEGNWYNKVSEEFKVKPIPSPSYVPKDITMDLSKLNKFLNEENKNTNKSTSY